MFNWIIGIPLLTIFTAVGLALVVIPSSRGESSRPTLNILLVLISLWAFFSFIAHSLHSPSTLFWMHLVILCGAFTSAIGLHFSAQFARYHDWKAKWIVRLFYMILILIALSLLQGGLLESATLLPDGSLDIQFGATASLMWGFLGGGTLLAIGFLIRAFQRASPPDRGNSLFPLLGFIIMCLGILSNVFVSSYPVDIAANFVFISLITYGVVRGHMLKPSIKLPWPKTLPVTVFLLGLCYAALLTLFHVWMGFNTATANIIAGLITLGFSLVTVDLIRTPFLTLLQKGLFPSTYRYRQALSKLAGLECSLLRWDNSIINALNIIIGATRANGAVLLLRNNETRYFEAAHAAGNDAETMLQIKLPIESPIITYLGIKDVPRSNEEIKQATNMVVMVRGKDDTLRELGSTLYYSINAHDGPLAIVAITGDPRKDWNEDEVKDFMKLACQQIANNIINAELYKTSKREIIERNRVEEKVRETNNLKELDRLRAELLANVSHELRTPLASIKGFSTMMLDYGKRLKANDKRQYLKYIDEASDRLAEMINQLLDMSRLEAGMLTLNKEIINIGQLFEDIVTAATIGFNTHRISLDLPQGLPKMNIDIKRIRQVVDNIISNAVKYSNPGTLITIAVHREENELIIKISDQGFGVPEEDQPRIFERMFRSNNPSSTVMGTGLGLGICKGLIEAHGGRIWIESKEGWGTQCYFTLPIHTSGDDSCRENAPS